MTRADLEAVLADPLVLVGIAAAVLTILLIGGWRRGARQDRAASRLAAELRRLAAGQGELGGRLSALGDARADEQRAADARLTHLERHVGERLAATDLRQARALTDMQDRMRQVLDGQSRQTATSLTRLTERLATIDRAQEKIERLSGDVLGLQDILSNKQRRGLFGEIQLADIVGGALPSDAFSLQSTLSNGRRVDCLVHLPDPPGPIAIDAKFPLEAFEAYAAADHGEERARALKSLGAAVRGHVRAIAERYILEGETADGAMMFVPSEAVYATLHAEIPQIVREGFQQRVWIVSPTTCMAVLNTMRGVMKDARMREHAGAIRAELQGLHGDLGRLSERVGNLDRHMEAARRDVEQIRVSSEKAGRRAQRLHDFDFDDDTSEAAAHRRA